MGETELAALFCAFLAGSETETRSFFEANGDQRHVRIDCETDDYVFEVGLDNSASARDSVHQALFFQYLTGKTPVVVIIDTDGVEDRYEHEIRVVARQTGVAFGVCSADFILRWAATSPWRDVGLDKTLDDLPIEAAVQSNCALPFDVNNRSLGLN